MALESTLVSALNDFKNVVQDIDYQTVKDAAFTLSLRMNPFQVCWENMVQQLNTVLTQKEQECPNSTTTDVLFFNLLFQLKEEMGIIKQCTNILLTNRLEEMETEKEKQRQKTIKANNKKIKKPVVNPLPSQPPLQSRNMPLIELVQEKTTKCEPPKKPSINDQNLQKLLVNFKHLPPPSVKEKTKYEKSTKRNLAKKQAPKAKKIKTEPLVDDFFSDEEEETC